MNIWCKLACYHTPWLMLSLFVWNSIREVLRKERYFFLFSRDLLLWVTSSLLQPLDRWSICMYSAYVDSGISEKPSEAFPSDWVNSSRLNNPIVVTHYHKHSSFKHSLMIGVWKSENQSCPPPAKVRVPGRLGSFWKLKWTLTTGVFQFGRSAYYPWLIALFFFLIFKTINIPAQLSHDVISLVVAFTPLSSSIKGQCG